MDHNEKGINTRNCLDSTQDRDYWRALVNAALNLHKPWLVIIITLATTDSYLGSIKLNMIVKEMEIKRGI